MYVEFNFKERQKIGQYFDAAAIFDFWSYFVRPQCASYVKDSIINFFIDRCVILIDCCCCVFILVEGVLPGLDKIKVGREEI